MGPRRYKEADHGALVRLATLAFGMGASYWENYYDPEKNPRLDPDLVYVVEEDGEVRASATVLPMEAFVGSEPRPMGGVAAVAAHPAYRRRGFAGKLMRATLDCMRERGMRLSMLHPFAHSFYRAFGYELATEAIKYALKPSDLPTSGEQKRVRAYAESDLPGMIELLERWAAEHPCCPRRGEGRWRQIFTREGQEAAVYEGEGGLEATCSISSGRGAVNRRAPSTSPSSSPGRWRRGRGCSPSPPLTIPRTTRCFSPSRAASPCTRTSPIPTSRPAWRPSSCSGSWTWRVL